MSFTNDDFDIDALDLLTEDEKQFNKKYCKLILAHEPNGNRAYIKDMTAAKMALCRSQQARVSTLQVLHAMGKIKEK